jgi:hypothetical protein
MLIPLGFLAGSGGVSFESDYELIETQVLGSAQSSVTFTNLGIYSSTYKHLQVRATVRTTRSDAVNDEMYTRFNGDFGSNYKGHRLWGNGSSVSSGNTGIIYQADFPGSGATANVYGAFVMDILDPYSTTKNKTTRSLMGANFSFNTTMLSSGLWMSTASVTSINFAVSANLAAGSRFSLYGIKG